MLSLFAKKEMELNTQETFNLWESLRIRYDMLETVQIFENYLHDKDFELLTEHLLMRLLEDQINILEKNIKEANITMPKRPPKSTRTPVNAEIFTDWFIALRTLDILQTLVTSEIRIIRTSHTNDKIRNVFRDFLKSELSLLDKSIKYCKLKGWLGIPPQHPNKPKKTKEEIDNTEAFHLWDHLKTRYEALNLTQIYTAYCHDKDLKVIFSTGKNSTLEKQINKLEEEMDRFGIPLPERPPKTMETKYNAEMINDETMYRNIFVLIEYTIVLHDTAFKQSTTNDRIRNIFKSYLDEELDIYDNLIKYGKLKGWLQQPPMHRKAKE